MQTTMKTTLITLAFLILSLPHCFAQGASAIPLSSTPGATDDIFLDCDGTNCYASGLGKQYTASVPATPSVVQFSSGASNCGAASQNPSMACALSNTASGNRLWALAIDGANNVTSWNTPTTSGAGCSGVTWSNIGTSNAAGAIWESSVTSAGACTVTISASTSAGGGFIGTVYEVNSGTALNGTPGIGNFNASCSTSCTGASTTTTLANALVLAFTASTGTAGSPACVVPGTTDLNIQNTNAGPWTLGCHGLEVSTATYQLAWSGGGGVGWYSNIVAITP